MRDLGVGEATIAALIEQARCECAVERAKALAWMQRGGGALN